MIIVDINGTLIKVPADLGTRILTEALPVKSTGCGWDAVITMKSVDDNHLPTEDASLDKTTECQEEQGKDVLTWCHDHWARGFLLRGTANAVSKRVDFHDMMKALAKGETVLEIDHTGRRLKYVDGRMKMYTSGVWHDAILHSDCLDVEYLILPEDIVNEDA